MSETFSVYLNNLLAQFSKAIPLKKLIKQKLPFYLCQVVCHQGTMLHTLLFSTFTLMSKCTLSHFHC